MINLLTGLYFFWRLQRKIFYLVWLLEAAHTPWLPFIFKESSHITPASTFVFTSLTMLLPLLLSSVICRDPYFSIDLT